jgi:hypothetical protein
VTKKQIRAKIVQLRKLLNAKPRGKAKGSGYEREIGKKIVHAFRKHGITKDDCHRTPRGSVEGDLKFGSALAKFFPYTVECKFYASIPVYHGLHTHDKMANSWPWKKFWNQLQAEVKITKKPGILIFRENNGVDLVSIYKKDALKGLFKTPRFVTYEGTKEIWTVSLTQFLKLHRRLLREEKSNV